MTKEEYEKKLKKIQLKNEEIELKNKLNEEKNKYRRFNLSKIKTSNKVLLSSIIAIVLFTIACLYIQYTTSIEVSSTLITFWYTFWTVEIVSLAGIKVTKVIKNYNSKETFCEGDLNCNLESDMTINEVNS